MDFRNVNLLNMRMNALSGNLLPMTSDGQFSIAWKIYSGFAWVIELVRTCGLIPGMMYVSRSKALENGGLIVIFVAEVIFMVMRIQSRGVLMRQFIRKLNDILRIEDDIMKNVVMATMEPMKLPLNFYWITGIVTVIAWACTPFSLPFKKSSFYYEDYRIPIALSTQPFSIGVFLLGCLLVLIACVLMFFKKVGLDIYMMHLVLMVTTQYRYIAVKLQKLFQEKNSGNKSDPRIENSYPRKTGSQAEEEIKAICRHLNTVIHLSFILKKLLALNFSIIYVNSILRFCFIGIMLSAILSSPFVEGFSVFMFACAEIIQFYILCSSVQQLLDASSKMTDMAFHENWYQFGVPVKRIFMLIILSNNLECKLAAYDKFNLSLPSFMTVMNQAYTIALLFLKVK